MSALRFRNVDADPADDVETWPYEALVTAIDRGSGSLTGSPVYRGDQAGRRGGPWPGGSSATSATATPTA